jgi:hypothetical protein
MIDTFVTKLEILAQDNIALAAISALINERIEKEKPVVGLTDSNNSLGEKFRAYETAKDILNGFFIDIENYKRDKSNKTFNKSV